MARVSADFQRHTQDQGRATVSDDHEGHGDAHTRLSIWRNAMITVDEYLQQQYKGAEYA